MILYYQIKNITHHIKINHIKVKTFSINLYKNLTTIKAHHLLLQILIPIHSILLLEGIRHKKDKIYKV